MENVIVVGGGLGGLLVAAELKRRGMEPVVLEASDRPGGVAQTVREDGYLLEPAASSVLLPNPQLSPILAAADVAFIPAKPEARTRFVYDRGTLFELAESPKSLFTRLVSSRAKLRAAREPWIKTPPPPGEESLFDFFTRRFGHDVGRLGADLMAHGVFAGDPRSLSIQAAFPKMVALEAAGGSIIKGAMRRKKESRQQNIEKPPRAKVHVAPDGMAGVAAGLVDYLGDGFRPDSPVHSVVRENGRWRVEWQGGSDTAGSLVVALPPVSAGQLFDGPLAALLADRPVAPVAVVGAGGSASEMQLPGGFGVLAGPDAGIRALGILFESSYAPGRAGDGHELAKGIYGGAADPEVMEMTDEELAAQMRVDLAAVLGHSVNPSWVRVVRSAIPQYPIGHAAWMAQVDEHLAAHPGLHFAGWGYRGIGVSTLSSEAARIASAIGA